MYEIYKGLPLAAQISDWAQRFCLRPEAGHNVRLLVTCMCCPILIIQPLVSKEEDLDKQTSLKFDSFETQSHKTLDSQYPLCFCFEFLQELLMVCEAISNTPKSVSSKFQTAQSRQKTRLCILFFNPILGVWKSDEPLFLMIDTNYLKSKVTI